jgi:hypothetical protein
MKKFNRKIRIRDDNGIYYGVANMTIEIDDTKGKIIIELHEEIEELLSFDTLFFVDNSRISKGSRMEEKCKLPTTFKNQGGAEISVSTPNATTLAAIQEVEDMRNDKLPKQHQSVADFEAEMGN